jgi:uncharacterized protein (TIGR02145 family)
MKTQFTKIAYVAGIVLALALTLSCSSDEDADPVVETYESVDIGSYTWMVKNRNYDVPNNDTDVCYDDDPDKCAEYGRLYNWATAMGLPLKCNSILSTSDADCAIKTPNHRGICPAGWHIPSDAEWDNLYRSADNTNGTNSPYDSETAGRSLKARVGWYNCGPSGKSYSCLDTKGFAALPGGKGSPDGSFSDVGRLGYWWSSSANDATYAIFREMEYNSNGARYHTNSKDDLYSVRCVKDN